MLRLEKELNALGVMTPLVRYGIDCRLPDLPFERLLGRGYQPWGPQGRGSGVFRRCTDEEAFLIVGCIRRTADGTRDLTRGRAFLLQETPANSSLKTAAHVPDAAPPAEGHLAGDVVGVSGDKSTVR